MEKIVNSDSRHEKMLKNLLLLIAKLYKDMQVSLFLELYELCPQIFKRMLFLHYFLHYTLQDIQKIYGIISDNGNFQSLKTAWFLTITSHTCPYKCNSNISLSVFHINYIIIPMSFLRRRNKFVNRSEI